MGKRTFAVAAVDFLAAVFIGIMCVRNLDAPISYLVAVVLALGYAFISMKILK